MLVKFYSRVKSTVRTNHSPSVVLVITLHLIPIKVRHYALSNCSCSFLLVTHLPLHIRVFARRIFSSRVTSVECQHRNDQLGTWSPCAVMLNKKRSDLCRRGHDDLGDHYLDCGDLSNALKCYSRARDYCTSAKHVINMCLNVIKVSQDLLTSSVLMIKPSY